MIRSAEAGDLPALREIERAAGRAFAGLGMHLVAGDEPPPVAALRRYQEGGRVWVSGEDVPLAYLLADEVDGCGHVEQVSVHPDAARRGLGRRLIDTAARWAAGRGLPALTLTTFVHVPWNGPYYERLGFRYLADHEITPGLRALRAEEAAHGLDAWPRACMRREVGRPGQCAGESS